MRLNSAYLDKSQHYEIIEAFITTYVEFGFVAPWIGYFVFDDEHNIVGCGGFKGKPTYGTVEIAYGTLDGYEGQGIATHICAELIQIALKSDPMLTIRARTLPKPGASTRILEKTGFRLIGNVVDKDDGNVWEWEFDKERTKQTELI